MDPQVSALTAGLIEIVWLDLLLAGDNAAQLALATRALPNDQRRLGVNLGSLLFMALRAAVLFAALACAHLPGFGVFAGLALICAALLTARRGEDRPATPAPPQRDIAAMLRHVLAADAPVALTNMLAVQVVSQGPDGMGHRGLAWLGLGLAFPMLALGAAQFVTLLRRPPLLWAGAALLGWLAGRSACADSLWSATAMPLDRLRDFAPPAGAALALALVFLYIQRDRLKRPPEERG